MFRNKNLMTGEMLGAWKLAHNIPIENIEKTNLSAICKELNYLVTTQAVYKRLSLRVSSNFIGGAVKLYKQSLDKLYTDIIKLNEDFIYRRRRIPRGRLDRSSSESADSMADYMVTEPELMREPAIIGFENSSFSPKKGRRTKSTAKMTARNTTNKPSENLLSHDTNSNEEDSADQSSDDANASSECTSNTISDGNQELDVEELFSEEENTESKYRNKGVQTSPILTSRKRRQRCGNINSHDTQGFDRNLPFGYIIIHDNYDSRIPTKWFTTTARGDTTQSSTKKSNENCWTELESRIEDILLTGRDLKNINKLSKYL